ncbi:hemoglobin subunit alpha-like [Genypterus blacodes]|uniref:hemoglobin subunit alpha-like n=1 Tax=Genypterus blacodes TaxID=154954 RepID=UPI003F75D73D
MSLSPKDKKNILGLWKIISKSKDAIGAEALTRLVVAYPQSKTYFSHWESVAPYSEPVNKHGRTVMGGVEKAIFLMDDLTGGLLELSEVHAFQLRVDPVNFKLFAHCLLVVIAMMFPKEFTPKVHISFDKFLTNLALALAEKYR